MEGAVQGKILFIVSHEHCYLTQQLDHFCRSIRDSHSMIKQKKKINKTRPNLSLSLQEDHKKIHDLLIYTITFKTNTKVVATDNPRV